MEHSWLKSDGPKHNYSYLPQSEPSDREASPSMPNDDVGDSYWDPKQQRLRTMGWYGFLSGVTLLMLLVLSHLWDKHNDSINLGSGSPILPGQPIQSSFKTVTHPDPPTQLWGTGGKPYPTGAFWTNMVVDSGDGPVGSYPYGIKTIDAGIQVSYGASRRIVSKEAITDNFVADLQIAAVQANAGARQIEKHDNFSVTVGYKTETSGKYRVHVVKSSPYVTVVYENAAPMITSNLMRIMSMEAQTVKDSKGAQYIVTLGNFQKWMIYCSEPLGLVLTGNAITSPVPIKGYIRVSILPVQNTMVAFNTLMQHVRRYPTGAVTTITYPSDAVAVLRVDYTTVGDGSLLMLALPHHIDLLVEPQLSSDENVVVQGALSPIWCIKGKLRAVLGTTWRLQYNLSQIGWNYEVSDKVSTARLDAVGVSLSAEVSTMAPTAPDAYSFGKQMQRLASLALLADNLGIAEARKTAITAMEDAFTPWLLGTNPNALLYDSTYGGVVPTNGIVDKSTDFGAGWYNDHHFHYGYLIFAAAAIAKIDGAYFADPMKKEAVDMLVRDICNPSDSDPQFPFARHKDLFDGHSWASGLTQQGNGKGQESSSEAVNAYYAVYLYALATTDKDLERFAHTMLTMEIVSVQKYWHMSDANIYDSSFAASAMVGNIGALDVTASTWFGNNAEFVHGINLMPISPATAVLFDVNYVKVEYPVLAARLRAVTLQQNASPIGSVGAECSDNTACSNLGISGLCCPTFEGVMLGCCDSQGGQSSGMQDEWRSLIHCDLAVVDRDTAWSRLQGMSNFGSGNSKANSLYWAATRSPPVPGFNSSNTESPVSKSKSTSCQANSACDALGMLGECCPSDSGVRLQCCPMVIDSQ